MGTLSSVAGVAPLCVEHRPQLPGGHASSTMGLGLIGGAVLERPSYSRRGGARGAAAPLDDVRIQDVRAMGRRLQPLSYQSGYPAAVCLLH
jgi:hypothetical protein